MIKKKEVIYSYNLAETKIYSFKNGRETFEILQIIFIF